MRLRSLLAVVSISLVAASAARLEAQSPRAAAPYSVVSADGRRTVAAVLVGYLHLHPAAAAAICFVPGLICCGIAIARMVPVLSRKVLILTNFRVIMADPFEVVDIDLL